jgi:hypothetical protein
MTCNEEAACIVFVWMQILPEKFKGLILFFANVQVMMYVYLLKLDFYTEIHKMRQLVCLISTSHMRCTGIFM